MGETDQAMLDLKASLDLSQARRKTNPAARDLLAEYLPIAIDKATPEGKLPAPEPGDVKKSGY